MKLGGLGLIVLLLFSCTQSQQNQVQKDSYFKVKEYFEKEVNRLNKRKPRVDKTVSINGVKEQRQLQIADFKNELNIFISSDINKASWNGAFQIKKAQDVTIYTTADEKIPVKRLEISYQHNKVKSISILLLTTNILYHSSDTLTYFPDSLYEIKKTQKIKLLNEKKYAVIGRFR